jgi:hypothetical protein
MTDALTGTPASAYDELVGPKEIAAKLGIASANVRQWQHRGILPEPATVRSGVPLWEWETIRTWARSKRHLRALLRRT